jgi:hypothetical protein
MNILKSLALIAVASLVFAVPVPKANAQISIGVQLDSQPDCPYGYYDTDPYGCAPYGYYGPEWFTGGVFIGAGPWFHGPRGFHGHVNNRFHPDNGYRGATPNRGDKRDESQPTNRVDHFRGNETRGSQGHVSGNRGGGSHGGKR